jgi:hypothetical protein
VSMYVLTSNPSPIGPLCAPCGGAKDLYGKSCCSIAAEMRRGWEEGGDLQRIDGAPGSVEGRVSGPSAAAAISNTQQLHGFGRSSKVARPREEGE